MLIDFQRVVLCHFQIPGKKTDFHLSVQMCLFLGVSGFCFFFTSEVILRDTVVLSRNNLKAQYIIISLQVNLKLIEQFGSSPVD